MVVVANGMSGYARQIQQEIRTNSIFGRVLLLPSRPVAYATTTFFEEHSANSDHLPWRLLGPRLVKCRIWTQQ
ncbi:hypothetical protein BT67DRAFT_438370 [Trichocladium antarcticum]|uniref:Uncharacterized protein n=1 Tax=Trichocladium antarcticum TaxID=1450529 RepID=A0AAN6UQJ7_9PEZI|nr:hypothetical protein BT67DRAFT_438370 [Trichocladium antarcticum]